MNKYTFEDTMRVFRALRQDGGGTGQVLALMALSEHGSQKLSGLATLTTLKRASITSVVDKLEQGGLAERYLDRHDRRLTMVRITDVGADRVRAAMDFSELERRAIEERTEA